MPLDNVLRVKQLNISKRDGQTDRRKNTPVSLNSQPGCKCDKKMHSDCVDHEAILSLHRPFTVNKGRVMNSEMTWVVNDCPSCQRKHHVCSGCNTKSCRPIIGPPVFIVRKEGLCGGAEGRILVNMRLVLLKMTQLEEHDLYELVLQDANYCELIITTFT